MDIAFQERLNLYEIAQETIGFMMAIRTESIHQEKKKPEPNVAQIAQWDKEFDHLHDELHGLGFDDDEKVRKILEEYCPVVKENFEKNKNRV